MPNLTKIIVLGAFCAAISGASFASADSHEARKAQVPAKAHPRQLATAAKAARAAKAERTMKLVKSQRGQIAINRRITWKYEGMVGKPRTRTSYSELRVTGLAYLRWDAKHWSKLKLAAKKYANSILKSNGFLPSDKARVLGRYLAKRKGWEGKEWSCLDELWGTKNHKRLESGWDVRADNPSSPAYGIPQADPGSKMSKFGQQWQKSARIQIRWGLYYIKTAYGTPCHALSVRKSQGSY
jgi:hypothetical protein